MTPVTPSSIDETGSNNPAGLAPDEVTKLIAGGPPAELKVVYPYDGTIFPSSTVAPLVMWTGNGAPDAIYLHVKSQAFEYKGVLQPGIGDALFVPGSNSSTFGPIANATAGAAEANNQLAIPLIAQRGRSVDDLDQFLAGDPIVTAWSAPLDSCGKLEADKVSRWGTMRAFGALYPDGSKYLASSGDAGLTFAYGLMPLSAATLMDAITGAVIPDTGIPDSAAMPNFSPDGTRLIFNDTKLGNSHGQ